MDFLVLSDIHHSWNHLDKMVTMAGNNDGVIFLGDLTKYGSNSEDVSLDLNNFSKICETAKFGVGVPGNGAIPKIVRYLDNLGISLHGKSHTLDDIGFFGIGGSPDPVALILGLRTFFKNESRQAIELHPRTLETLTVFGVIVKDDVFLVEDWDEAKEKELERFRGPFEHTEEEIYDILVEGFKSLSECSISVLISHVPPYEPIMYPKYPEFVSTGSKGITKFIKEFRPSIVLSGHYHSSYESEIDGIPYFILPAVIDGFYSILSINEDTKECKVTINSF
jgi:Icc-related predicted phosphoesterase